MNRDPLLALWCVFCHYHNIPTISAVSSRRIIGLHMIGPTNLLKVEGRLEIYHHVYNLKTLCINKYFIIFVQVYVKYLSIWSDVLLHNFTQNIHNLFWNLIIYVKMVWKKIAVLLTVKLLSMFLLFINKNVLLLGDNKYSVTALCNDEYLGNCKSYKRILYNSSVSNVSLIWHYIQSKSADLISGRIFMSICNWYSMFLSPCSSALNGHALGLLIRNYHATKLKSVAKKNSVL